MDFFLGFTLGWVCGIGFLLFAVAYRAWRYGPQVIEWKGRDRRE